ncbi:hypothetical protein LT493_41600 [Streptomyces tricolor]|nr:hypothetical protein [Streptomyces tricolor]
MPELLARTLPPGTVHTGVRYLGVHDLGDDRRARELRCRAVLLATDAARRGRAAAGAQGAGLPPGDGRPPHHGRPGGGLATGTSLLLDADRGGPGAHTAVLSNVDPSRAPGGRVLISSTVLARRPRASTRPSASTSPASYGTSTRRWETLAVHHTPRRSPPCAPARPAPPRRLLAGLYVCGDHRDTSTVQGALHPPTGPRRPSWRTWAQALRRTARTLVPTLPRGRVSAPESGARGTARSTTTARYPADDRHRQRRYLLAATLSR